MASKSISFVFLIVLLTTATLANPGTLSIMEVLQSVRQDWISTLLQAVRAANLVDTLQKEPGPFMLFAPLNGAFNKLPEGALAKLIGNPADLKKLLLRHVVKGSIEFGDLKSAELTNLDGGVLKLAVSGVAGDRSVTINEAKVYAPMNRSLAVANNGVIHYIDRVL